MLDTTEAASRLTRRGCAATRARERRGRRQGHNETSTPRPRGVPHGGPAHLLAFFQQQV